MTVFYAPAAAIIEGMGCIGFDITHVYELTETARPRCARNTRSGTTCRSTAAVVARPDEKWGEVPAAFIEIKVGAKVTAEDIVAHCQEHMARFKVLKYIEFCVLSKTSTGKIQKFVLRQQAKDRFGHWLIHPFPTPIQKSNTEKERPQCC